MNANIKNITESLYQKKDGDYHKVFIYLAVNADKNGLLTTSRRIIATDNQISEAKSERILNFLKSEQLIEQVKQAKNRLLKVLYKDVKRKTEQKSEQIKILFKDVTDFLDFRDKYEGNKQYLTIAYGFWKLWKDANPNSVSHNKMEVENWVSEIDKLIRLDEQTLERIIGIYCYFKKVRAKESGYRDFWFNTIKSVSAFRKKGKDEILYIEKIADEVNDKREKDLEFYNTVETAIKQIKAL